MHRAERVDPNCLRLALPQHAGEHLAGVWGELDRAIGETAEPAGERSSTYGCTVTPGTRERTASASVSAQTTSRVLGVRMATIGREWFDQVAVV